MNKPSLATYVWGNLLTWLFMMLVLLGSLYQGYLGRMEFAPVLVIFILTVAAQNARDKIIDYKLWRQEWELHSGAPIKRRGSWRIGAISVLGFMGAMAWHERYPESNSSVIGFILLFCLACLLLSFFVQLPIVKAAQHSKKPFRFSLWRMVVTGLLLSGVSGWIFIKSAASAQDVTTAAAFCFVLGLGMMGIALLVALMKYRCRVKVAAPPKEPPLHIVSICLPLPSSTVSLSVMEVIPRLPAYCRHLMSK